MLRTICAAVAMMATASVAMANEPAAPSADYGKTVSIIGGCNDCHTADYNMKGGVINPDTALKGNPVGYQGPWGTTYAVNLRLLASTMKEDDWVKYLQTFSARPPMPFYNVHAMDEVQMRSLYQYVVSLGAPGEPAPAYVPPGQKPTSPYNVFAPPVMP
jgi:mono/diheme cytochrome c family protein